MESQQPIVQSDDVEPSHSCSEENQEIDSLGNEQ